MGVSALVVTIADDARGERALLALAADPRLELGAVPPGTRRVPVVADTPSRAEDEALWGALWALDGVEGVELVLVHLDDDAPEAAGQGGRRLPRALPPHAGRAPAELEHAAPGHACATRGAEA